MSDVMEAFRPAEFVLPIRAQFIDAYLRKVAESRPATKHDREAAGMEYERLRGAVVMENDQYVVEIDKNPRHGWSNFSLWHLRIRRKDGGPCHNWRHLQFIKSDICGPNIEAIELYPDEQRAIDRDNSAHLYAFMGMRVLQPGVEPYAPMLPVGMMPVQDTNLDALLGNVPKASNDPEAK